MEFPVYTGKTVHMKRELREHIIYMYYTLTSQMSNLIGQLLWNISRYSTPRIDNPHLCNVHAHSYGYTLF